VPKKIVIAQLNNEWLIQVQPLCVHAGVGLDQRWVEPWVEPNKTGDKTKKTQQVDILL
jgi:hypothetical protein